jgi:hypothetical protein
MQAKIFGTQMNADVPQMNAEKPIIKGFVPLDPAS